MADPQRDARAAVPNAECPQRLELCARRREQLPCLGVLYRPQPGVAYCRRCGATDGAAVGYVREAQEGGA